MNPPTSDDPAAASDGAFPGHAASPPEGWRVAVVQDGARLHYAVPLALHRAGALRWMFTDWFVGAGPLGRALRWAAHRFGRGPVGAKVRRALDRRCDEIPRRLVRTQPPRFPRRGHPPSAEAAWADASRRTGDWIVRRGWGDANALFGFVRNVDPRLCATARAGGLVAVADQMIAPAPVEAAEAGRQCDRWTDWEPPGRRPDLALVADLERQTWANVDLVTCPSAYVRDGLLAHGVPPDRTRLIPYPIDAGRYAVVPRRGRPGPVVVGFVGGVGLRKGAPYFLDVARRLAGPAVRFVMVGAVHLTDAAARSFAGSVDLIGPVPRSDVTGWLDRFDLLLFPSTCEGSAGAVMEAMAAGLPVVTSPNSGTIARDGVDGFVRPYDEVDALAACVDRLVTDPALRLAMGAEARRAAEAATVDRYGQQLLQAMTAALADRLTRI